MASESIDVNLFLPKPSVFLNQSLSAVVENGKPFVKVLSGHIQTLAVDRTRVFCSLGSRWEYSVPEVSDFFLRSCLWDSRFCSMVSRYVYRSIWR